MNKNKWKVRQQKLEDMRRMIEVILADLDPTDTEEVWLGRELSQIHDILTGGISHCRWNAKE